MRALQNEIKKKREKIGGETMRRGKCMREKLEIRLKR